MITLHRSRRHYLVRMVLGTLLFAVGQNIRGQSTISPSFQGASASNNMSFGTMQMSLSGPQTAASAIASGANAIQSGFFAFLAGTLTSATIALPGQGLCDTIATAVGTFVLTLPPNSVPPGTEVSVDVPLTVPPPGTGMTSVADTAIEIHSGSQPSIPAILSFSYERANIAGEKPDQFIVARYDTDKNVWVPLISSVDTVNHIVTARTNHFSLFQVMQVAPSNTVSTAKAFPNPLRPSLGQTAMTFVGLSASARIRIYTLKGIIIKDLTADASGTASWDATNQSGAQAASGVYFVYAQGAGESRTLTVAIQR